MTNPKLIDHARAVFRQSPVRKAAHGKEWYGMVCDIRTADP